MDRVVFFIASHTRKPEYRIQTMAIKKNSKVVFKKHASSPKASGQLKKMADLYEEMKLLHPNTKLATPKLSNNSETLELENLEGQSIESLLLEAILRNKKKDVLLILDEYEKLLDGMAIKKKTSAFTSDAVFGKNAFDSFSNDALLYPGLIDLNFDNIIKNQDGRLGIIDYEWSFDEYIPKDYILSRALMWFGIRYAELFKLNASRIDLVGLSQELVLPSVVYERYAHLQKQIEQTYKIEWDHLQKWINTPFSKDLHPPHHKNAVTNSVFSLESLRASIGQLSDEKEILLTQIESLRNENNNIKRSKAYRLISKAKRIVRRIK